MKVALRGREVVRVQREAGMALKDLERLTDEVRRLLGVLRGERDPGVRLVLMREIQSHLIFIRKRAHG